jgi:hypothetical protein
MARVILLTLTHAATLAVGFVIGIYTLPILTAPTAPDSATLAESAAQAKFTGTLTRDLKGSDFLHWGEGTVSLTPTQIAFTGKLAPGPDYKLYLVTDFAVDEASFAPLKASAKLIGDVKSFDGFLLDLPEGTDLTVYTTVLVWCESFGEFITAAKYR